MITFQFEQIVNCIVYGLQKLVEHDRSDHFVLSGSEGFHRMPDTDYVRQI